MLPPQGCEAGTGDLGDGGRQTRHHDPAAEQTHGGWKRPLQGMKCIVYLRGYFLFFFSPIVLSVECNSISLGGPAHGIVTKTLHKTLPGLLCCMFKTGSCAIISSHISSKFTGEVA